MYSQNKFLSTIRSHATFSLWILVTALLGLMNAAPPAEADGAIVASFADLEPGGRGAGLAGAFSPVVNDASALYWNPARLIEVRQGSLSATYADLFSLDLVHNTSVFVAFPVYSPHPSWSDGEIREEGIKPFMTWGVGLVSTSVDLDPENYHENDIAFGFGRQGRFGFSYGLVAHYLTVGSDVQQTEDDKLKASGYSLDLAISRSLHPTLSLSVVLKSLTSSLSHDNASKETLVPRAICGFNWSPAGNLNIPVALVYNMESNLLRQFSGGVEWSPAGDIFTVRGGLRWRDGGKESEIFPGAGLSFHLNPVTFDYGFAAGREELGDTHRLGLGLLFN